MGDMTAQANAPLRIASFNIRAGLGTDLRRDARRVLDVLADLRPDIVALQEADFRTGPRRPALPPDLIREVTGLAPLPVAANGISLGWHGNAILARPDLPLTGLTRLTLPGLEPRGAVVADIGGALPLRLVAVHLGLLRRSRRQQADAIRAALGDLPDRPTLILGDFNEWSRRQGLGRIARHFTLVTPRATWPARAARAPLDRMAHSPDIDLHLVDLPRPGRHFASDHLPILAEIRAR